MSQVRTRKRGAPGTAPLGQGQTPTSNASSANQTLNWNPQESSTSSNSASNGSYTGLPYYNTLDQDQYSDQAKTRLSHQVARRAANQPLVSIQNYGAGPNGQNWQMGTDGAGDMGSDQNWSGQYDDLDQKALLAKKDAESKRKPIPPFVQKLSSFLDESRNTDLIRWSFDGDSFIVLDEDEFARTLIPELFKHNNYASFVRQLNMYGFHKKVGLSDNSMRASERKNKNPSEYSNPYFKRGRPNLLWLIQKPRNAAMKPMKGGARAKQDDYDEEVDETFGRDDSPVISTIHPLEESVPVRGGRQNLLTMGNMATALPQDEFRKVQQELAGIRQNQIKIKNMLEATRREHQQLYGQAKAFQDQHEKHDNSINAILTFLATVYNKNLNSGQGGMGDMFSGALRSGESGGNVVDMGDVRDQGADGATPQPYRKPQLLLGDGKSGLATTTPSYEASHRSSRLQQRPSTAYLSDKNSLNSPAIQELSDATPTSNRSSESPKVINDTYPTSTIADPDQRNQPQSQQRYSPPQQQQQNQQQQQAPQVDIMSMLNNANAAQNNKAFTPGTPMDFTEALSHLQHSGGSTPLTPGQRQNMLQLMGNEYPSNAATAAGATSDLTYPPPSADQFNPNDILASQSHYDQTGHSLDQLGHIIKEQSNNINNLSNTLTPLSPSGSIPGIHDQIPSSPSYPAGNSPHNGLLPADLFDIDHIFNTDGYFGNVNNVEGTGNDFDPDFDFGNVPFDPPPSELQPEPEDNHEHADEEDSYEDAETGKKRRLKR